VAQIKIGLNLLTCNLAQCPIHEQAARYAIASLLDSDIALYDWRLVIVDNASTCPKTVALLQGLEATNERVAIEWSDENLGIGKGRNLGFQVLHEWHAPEYMVEVHTDMVFPANSDRDSSVGWLQPIIEYMEHPKNADVAIMGPSLLTAGGQWYSPRPSVPYQLSEVQLQDYETFRAEVTKAALVWRRPKRVRPGLSHPAVKRWSALEAIGTHRDGKLHPYDPDMPGRQNFEDTEEAFRAHAAGWRVLIHFGSMVFHNYHLTRLGLSDHPADYDANNRYVQVKHGPAEWVAWNGLIGKWMEEAYRR